MLKEGPQYLKTRISWQKNPLALLDSARLGEGLQTSFRSSSTLSSAASTN